MDTDTAREAIRRLDILMTTRRAYRDPRLTLASLAATLGLPRHQLSQILNQHLGESLTDYLNRLRIEDVKASLLAAENDVYTVEAVARTAGFASRSVFYRAFVRATGQTPTAWRRSGRAG
ncbi:MAG TPA: helix-turn-helix domain-containing protein [Vicinamibacterales bacterium]|nr:helix-turn-helix domain-containing protein [Vicinamibacterales bacterium]